MKKLKNGNLLAAKSAPAASAEIAGYEPPEMIQIAAATTLLRGIVMTKPYYDCMNDSTTDYPCR